MRKVSPTLVAVDCAALLVAWWIVPSVGVISPLVTAAVVLGLNAAAGQYRPRADTSTLRELPGLFVRAAAAGGLVAAAYRLLFDLSLAEGLLILMAGYFVLAGLGRTVVHLVSTTSGQPAPMP